MGGSCLILAAVGDLAWVIIALASFVVWVFNQIKKANEEAAKKNQPKPRPQPPAAPPRSGQQGSAGRQQPPVRGQQTSSRLASTPRGLADSSEKQETVAGHVRKHLDAQEFEQRTGSLGHLEYLASGVDDHVHQAFDHDVSSINDQGEVTEGEQAAAASAPSAAAGIAAAGTAAAGIAELFADPDGLRSAIILQEVLRPPKWD